MKSANCSGSKKSMEILFNVQPTLPWKNKIVLHLSEHDGTFLIAMHVSVISIKKLMQIGFRVKSEL
jgi:hypothetical protein